MTSRDHDLAVQRQAETDTPRLTLDTSGGVFLDPATHDFIVWEFLTPFAQGFTEGLFASFRRGDIGHWPDHLAAKIGFKDLAPATLSRIIGDCERYEGEHRVLQMLGGGERTFGRALWVDRQEGKLPAYPVLTVSLGEDGLIYLREAAQ